MVYDMENYKSCRNFYAHNLVCLFLCLWVIDLNVVYRLEDTNTAIIGGLRKQEGGKFLKEQQQLCMVSTESTLAITLWLHFVLLLILLTTKRNHYVHYNPGASTTK